MCLQRVIHKAKPPIFHQARSIARMVANPDALPNLSINLSISSTSLEAHHLDTSLETHLLETSLEAHLLKRISQRPRRPGETTGGRKCNSPKQPTEKQTTVTQPGETTGGRKCNSPKQPTETQPMEKQPTERQEPNPRPPGGRVRSHFPRHHHAGRPSYSSTFTR